MFAPRASTHSLEKMLRPLAVGPSNRKNTPQSRFARFAAVARFAFAGAVLAVGLATTGACSNQSEGQRCNLDGNGNDDCIDGLICTSQRDLFGVNSDVCCPGDRTTATTAVCQINHAPVGGNPLPPDSGADASPTSDATTSDATSDATDGG